MLSKKKGIYLTMFISFIVPIAHSLLGFFAVPWFLVPTVVYVPRAVVGFLYWVWGWLAQFFFGFQNVETFLRRVE